MWCNTQEYSTLDLVQVVSAYSNRQDFLNLPEYFFVALEQAILEISQQLTADQAVRLLGAMTRHASSELCEVFDRIIGAKIDELSPSDLCGAYGSFKVMKKAEVRPKIFAHLLKRLSNNLELLPIDELCSLALFTAQNEQQKSLCLSEFILSRAEQLSEFDIQICLEAFERSGDVQSLETFEQICVSNLVDMSLETVT